MNTTLKLIIGISVAAATVAVFGSMLGPLDGAILQAQIKTRVKDLIDNLSIRKRNVKPQIHIGRDNLSELTSEMIDLDTVSAQVYHANYESRKK